MNRYVQIVKDLMAQPEHSFWSDSTVRASEDPEGVTVKIYKRLPSGKYFCVLLDTDLGIEEDAYAKVWTYELNHSVKEAQKLA